MAQLDIYTLAFACFTAALILLSLVFVYAWRQKRLDIVDTFWGISFIAIALTAAVIVQDLSGIGRVILGCVLVWGMRLALHIGRRFIKSKKQDARYTDLQASWPTTAPALQAYGRIFVAQAILATVISLPVIMAINSTDYTPYYLYIGFVVWVVGLGFEIISDRQLRQFVTNPDNAGQLMTRGLWNYSRHPNYFGELTLWWGIGIMVLGTSYGVAGLIGPLIITLLICFVSGIPPAERQAADRDGWHEYKRTTSVIIPWLKRS